MSRQDFTFDDIEHALRFLDCENTDVWLRAGMAIKSEFGESGFGIWDAWSQGDSRYREKEVRNRWKSFKGGSARGSVSIGTILHWAFERGFKIERPELTGEQKAAFAAEQAERRKRVAEQAALDEANMLRWYEAVAAVSKQIMPLLKTVGSSPYLGKKKIPSFGCLFPSEPFLLDFKDDFTIDVLQDRNAINAVFARMKANKAAGLKDADTIAYAKRGDILIPLFNEHGDLRNFQIIHSDGKKKRFLAGGQKTGLWFLIKGAKSSPDSPLIFCEGFATGASDSMATGWDVVVTVDAGNMPAVAEKFVNDPRKKIFAGDNDWETALDPKKKNTGLVKCQEAARIARGAWCVPDFAGLIWDAAGLSDFNDLHLSAGLDAVRMQICNALDHFPDAGNMMPDQSEPVLDMVAPPDYGDIPMDGYEDYLPQQNSEVSQNHSSEVRQQSLGEKTVFSISNVLERFRFVTQDASVWDTKTESQIKKTAFNDLVGKALADEWRAHDDRLDINEGQIQAVKIKRAREAREARFTESERWQLNFIYNERGEIKADIGNAKLVLENDPAWRGVIRYCDFSYRVLKNELPPFANSSCGEWTDSDTDRLRIWLSEKYRFTPKTADALGAVVVVAEANRFHPVRDYLQGLKWDGVARLDRWLYGYMGAENGTYSTLVGRMFLIGAVARVMRPPVKMDTVLIFEGLQGLGKSTALKILGGEWFTDTPLVLGDKDCFQQMQGVWIIELAELDSFNKADHTRAKQFFGSQVDRFRPSYGRLTQTFARQCVFAGSTNQTEYMRDATGNRRYWPVTCTKVDSVALERDRDMLWAEALHAYLAGEQWWPDESHKDLFSDQQERRFEADVWEALISNWLASTTKSRVLMHEIMEEALGLEASQMKPPEQKRVGQIMAHLGWQRVRARVPGGRETGYERPIPQQMAA